MLLYGTMHAMRLRIASDLHVDSQDPARVELPRLPDDENSTLVLAGDYGTPFKMAQWIKLHATHFAHIVMVLGNHDYWKYSLETAPRKWREGLAKHLSETELQRIHILEKESIVLDGVRFMGTTLWTNFRNQELAMKTAEKELNDYRYIRVKNGAYKLKAKNVMAEHYNCKNWILHTLAQDTEHPTVVITHFPPMSIPHIEWKENELLPAYINDMGAEWENFLDTQPDIWIHGHVHHAYEHLHYDTLVTSNPHGYPKENTGFLSTRTLYV